MTGFTKHIKEAIRINKERKPQYALLSGGKSKTISNILIFTEYLAIPLAFYFEKRASKFNKKGIRIVADDFVPMLIPESSNPIGRANMLNQTDKQAIKDFRIKYNLEFPKKIRSVDELDKAFKVGVTFLAQVKNYEKGRRLHFPMLIHLLESQLLIIRNSKAYYIESSGNTVKLSSSLIKIHKFAINLSHFLDYRANKFHVTGIGILVNDLPEINFK